VLCEISANEFGIAHFVYVPETWAATIENLFQAHLPGVGYERVPVPAVAVEVAAEYRLSTTGRPLRVDPIGLSTRLLTNLQPLRAGEQIIVQWALAPAAPVAPAQGTAAGARHWSLLPAPELSHEDVAAWRAKQAHPLLVGLARTGVAAASLGRSRRLLRQVEAAWHGTRAPGVQLHRRLLSEQRVASRLRRGVLPFSVWPGLFNAEELTGLLGWPVGVEQLPGLVLGGCRPLAPSPLIPSTGTIIGEANFPGSARPVAVDIQGRLRHLHVIGPTGTGKSTLLAHLIEQDLEAGHGVVVVDPKGDLISDVLARIPRRRRSDVIVLDPADEARPVGLNPLRSADGAQAEVAVENLVGLLKSLYRSSWGPRTDDILRAALLTLAQNETATLCEVPILLTDSSYRRRLVGRLDDPIGLESFWGWYEGLSEPERFSVVGPVLNKVRAFTMRPRVRVIVGQAAPALDMREVLARRQILLVSLAAGVLGEEAASLLGALVVAELWHATTARARLPRASRHPVMAHIDEFQNVVHLPTPMPAVLAESRGLGLGLTLAHQHVGQLPNDVRDAVLANARSRVVFQLPAQDAGLLARELGGGLTPDDLQGLGAFEVAAQLYAAGRTQPPLTAKTQGPSATRSDADEVRANSRQRYGAERSQVEAEIRERHQGATADTPIGRRRRGGAS